jgi:hypothetical protein
MTKSPPSLLDPTFRYVQACRTNVRATFARIKRELAEQAKADAEAEAVAAKERTDKVRNIVYRKKA